NFTQNYPRTVPTPSHQELATQKASVHYPYPNHKMDSDGKTKRSLLSASPAPKYFPTKLYTSYNDRDRRSIDKIISDIGTHWYILSIGTAFPMASRPEIQARDWGLELLSAILHLAEISPCLEGHAYAVEYLCDRIESVNEGLSENEGDYVIRLEDVVYAWDKIEREWAREGDYYRPGYC
ncbi:hypothetical protein K458DRAFT_469575, partial [Lentithecium fluviatile CBS 122367]